MAIYKFDTEIADTVKLLNKIEGVYPASSCGGHENPKNSGIKIQCPLGCFYIILQIKNEEFFNILNETIAFYNEDEPLIEFEYNPLYKTWWIGSSNVFKDDVLIPLAESYLKETKKYKPKDDWDMYSSYCQKPIRIK